MAATPEGKSKRRREFTLVRGSGCRASWRHGDARHRPIGRDSVAPSGAADLPEAGLRRIVLFGHFCQASEAPIQARDEQHRIERQWLRLVAGGDAGPEVRPLVRESWRRSGVAGVLPGLGRAPLALDEDALAETRESTEWLGVV